MKNAPAFLLACILLSGCVTGSRPDSKPDKPGQDTVKKDETVVLLHGQGRSRLSMVVLGKRFRSAGYETLNFPYNQTIDSLDEISDQLIEFIAKKAKTTHYHLIGHSLGDHYPQCLSEEIPGRQERSSCSLPNQPAHLAKLFKKSGLPNIHVGQWAKTIGGRVLQRPAGPDGSLRRHCRGQGAEPDFFRTKRCGCDRRVDQARWDDGLDTPSSRAYLYHEWQEYLRAMPSLP